MFFLGVVGGQKEVHTYDFHLRPFVAFEFFVAGVASCAGEVLA